MSIYLKRFSFFIGLFFSATVFAKTYYLPKGTHGFYWVKFPPTMSNDYNYRVRFDETAIYTTRDPSNQSDINKLFGFADCTSFVHTNSARFGWRWYQNQLQILAYTYAKKVRSFEYVQTVQLNTSYDLKILTSGDQYIFYVDGVEKIRMKRGCSSPRALKYKLYPFFGGNEVAPHDISIELD
ncbi:MAG: hypothetical protein ACOYL6_06265 [Bacteriovoracaceae bacterium]